MDKVNIYTLAKNCVLDIQSFNDYFNSVYAKDNPVIIKEQDKESLKAFCDNISNEPNIITMCNDFYFCFSIAQISKEFDLLKITKNAILNIELKSNRISDEQMIKQLNRNRYYCKHLTNNIVSLVYIANENVLYKLNDGLLTVINNSELTQILLEFCNYECEYQSIDNLFRPSMFLISPLNTPYKFIDNEYFLTDRQQEIKSQVITLFNSNITNNVIKLTGNPGTGKTLLLYDIAKEIASYNQNVCIIHCGKLCRGHFIINEQINNLCIISIKDLNTFNLDKFNYVFVDESHRMYKYQFEYIVQYAKDNNINLVFSIDPKQVMQKSEIRANIDGNLDTIASINRFTLTDKIRTNKEMASFIKNLFDLSKSNKTISYKNINIINVNTIEDAKRILTYYQTNLYTFISFTESRYKRHLIDNFRGDANTHEVIGQEYDNVVMLLDSEFYYRNNELTALEHPCPNYLFEKLLYQGITRVREKLCIVILNNIDLSKKIIEILENK